LLQFEVKNLLEASTPNQFNHGVSTLSTWEALDLGLLEALMGQKAATLVVVWEDLSLVQVLCLAFHQAMVCDPMTWAKTSCTMT